MDVLRTEIPDVLILQPSRHADRRGFFSETYNRRLWVEAGVACDFVQDNHSLSARRGVVRGLHFQAPPMSQDKLIRCVRGAVFDVAVDLRGGSPTYGRWVGAELTADNWKQVFVPRGFAHGFMTLAPDTEVCYKVSQYYSPEHDRGIRFDDPDLAIDWHVAPAEVIVSQKDAQHPLLADLPEYFRYGQD